jgi:chromate transporter
VAGIGQYLTIKVGSVGLPATMLAVSKAPINPSDLPREPRPSFISQMSVWSTLGVQSFGGGVATLSLIRRAVVDDHQWMTDVEFSEYWALVQLAPGINLVGLTILIGQKVGGPIGIVIALFGLLLPSSAITVLLTALYARFQHVKIVAAAVSGIIPATIGLGFVTAVQIALPILQSQLKRGPAPIVVGAGLFVGSALIFAACHWPVAVILLLAGVIGGVAQFAKRPGPEVEPQ